MLLENITCLNIKIYFFTAHVRHFECNWLFAWIQLRAKETFSFLPDVPSFNLCTFLLWSLFFSPVLYKKLWPLHQIETKQTRSVFPMNFTLHHIFLLFSSLSFFFFFLHFTHFCSMRISSLSFSSMEIVKAHNVVPSIHSQWTISAVRLLKVDSSSQE